MDCPNFCPMNCGQDDMMCSGGMDMNDCMMPDFCMPSKGKLFSKAFLNS